MMSPDPILLTECVARLDGALERLDILSARQSENANMTLSIAATHVQQALELIHSLQLRYA